MKIFFITLSTALLIAFSIPVKAAGDCPTPINIRWIAPGCDTITVALIFTTPCNGKCGNDAPSACQLTSAPTTLVSEGHDGSLTIPCCARDIKVRISGGGHTLQIPYTRNGTGSANGMVILIDDEGNMRVNGKASPRPLISSSQF